jgi:hypothetical protein
MELPDFDYSLSRNQHLVCPNIFPSFILPSPLCELIRHPTKDATCTGTAQLISGIQTSRILFSANSFLGNFFPAERVWLNKMTYNMNHEQTQHSTANQASFLSTQVT